MSNHYDDAAADLEEELLFTQRESAFYVRLRDRHREEPYLSKINGILITLNTIMEILHGQIIDYNLRSRDLEELRRGRQDTIQSGNGPGTEEQEGTDLFGDEYDTFA